MALSQKTKEIMIVALANKVAGQELAAAVDAGSNEQAVNVADLSIAAVGSTDGAGGAGDAALAADVDSRLGDVETSVNAILAALQAAGLMA